MTPLFSYAVAIYRYFESRRRAYRDAQPARREQVAKNIASTMLYCRKKKSKQLCMHIRDDNIELQFMAFNDFTHFLHFCSSMAEGGSP